MLVDTHGHLNFNAYKDDSKEALERALSAGISLIMPGSQYSTSKRAVELAEKWNDSRVWAAVGLHPIHIEKRKVDKNEVGEHIEYETYAEKFDREKYQEFAKSDKVVAIGEVGLDYWYRPKDKSKRAPYENKQAEALKEQMNFALDMELPLILHCRIAHKNLIKILRDHPHTEKFDIPGVVHSYTGSAKQFKEFEAMGYYIGVNGLIFKLDLVRDAVKAAPLERIVLETDAPYLNPPQVEEERNEPANLKYIAEKIAEIKGVPFEEVEKQTTENAQRVFGVEFK